MGDGLVELSYATLSMEVDGETWTFARLRQADFAQAAQFLHDRWKQSVRDELNTQPYDPATRAEAVVKMHTRNPSNHEVMQSAHARIELFRLSLKRGGRVISHAELAEKMPPLDYGDHIWLLDAIVGFQSDPPTPPSGGTVTSPKSSTPPSPPNEATSSPTPSPPSAATTG